jgi:hypothetical protein
MTSAISYIDDLDTLNKILEICSKLGGMENIRKEATNRINQLNRSKNK